MGNPFLEQSKDLLVLRTRFIMDSSASETSRIIKELGKAQCLSTTYGFGRPVVEVKDQNCKICPSTKP